jgi:hypothetical protein
VSGWVGGEFSSSGAILGLGLGLGLVLGLVSGVSSRTLSAQAAYVQTDR